MAEEEEPKKHIVIDNGSGSCKVGFSGEEKPSSIVPSYVGYPNYTIMEDEKKFYVGQDAKSNLGKLTLSYPIEHGVVTNWDEMEKIYDHIYKNELKVDPVEHNFFLLSP